MACKLCCGVFAQSLLRVSLERISAFWLLFPLPSGRKKRGWKHFAKQHNGTDPHHFLIDFSFYYWLSIVHLLGFVIDIEGFRIEAKAKFSIFREISLILSHKQVFGEMLSICQVMQSLCRYLNSNTSNLLKVIFLNKCVYIIRYWSV